MNNFSKKRHMKKFTKKILMNFLMYPDDTFDEDEALVSALPLDEDVHTFTPTHEDKEMVTFYDGIVKDPLHTIEGHIDYFHTGWQSQVGFWSSHFR
jgi:hypothetical protein